MNLDNNVVDSENQLLVLYIKVVNHEKVIKVIQNNKIGNSRTYRREINKSV